MIVVGSMDEILIRSSPSIFFQLCDQPDQIEFTLAILPDVDAGQHNFPIASCHKDLGLSDHVIQEATPLMPACEGDETEAAHHVAAVLDLEQRSGGVWFAILR